MCFVDLEKTKVNSDCSVGAEVARKRLKFREETMSSGLMPDKAAVDALFLLSTLQVKHCHEQKKLNMFSGSGRLTAFQMR